MSGIQKWRSVAMAWKRLREPSASLGDICCLGLGLLNLGAILGIHGEGVNAALRVMQGGGVMSVMDLSKADFTKLYLGL